MGGPCAPDVNDFSLVAVNGEPSGIAESVLAVGCSCVLPPRDGIHERSQCHCQSSESQTALPQLLSWGLASLAQVLAKPCFLRLSCLAYPSVTVLRHCTFCGQWQQWHMCHPCWHTGFPGRAGTDSRRSCRALQAHASIHTSGSKAKLPRTAWPLPWHTGCSHKQDCKKCSKQHHLFTGHCSWTAQDRAPEQALSGTGQLSHIACLQAFADNSILNPFHVEIWMIFWPLFILIQRQLDPRKGWANTMKIDSGYWWGK